jgi:hypothetical protein
MRDGDVQEETRLLKKVVQIRLEPIANTILGALLISDVLACESKVVVENAYDGVVAFGD